LPWPWHGKGQIGVPVRDYIAQSGEFIVCGALAAWAALEAWRRRQTWIAGALSLLILALLANVLSIATSRTALVVIPALLLLFAWRQLSGRAAGYFLLAAVVAAALAWVIAPTMRHNVITMLRETQEFQPEGVRTRAGERLEFWRKSIGFIINAPIIGHGTGSIRDQFRHSVDGRTGMAAVASANPHNQTFAVAIQLGLIGTVVLFGMWLAHAMLFSGTDLAHWVGLVIVAQNIVGSLFNSHLFDFAQGWGYVIGVGVAAGVVFKQRDCLAAPDKAQAAPARSRS
jgi:O-antigen ligase